MQSRLGGTNCGGTGGCEAWPGQSRMAGVMITIDMELPSLCGSEL